MLLKSQIQAAFEAQQIEFAGLPVLIDRDIMSTYAPAKQHIEVVTGIRRCGKSSFLRQIRNKFYPESVYFNFEDARIFGFDVDDFSKLDDVIGNTNKVYFFDEIQNVPSWELYVRQLHDRNCKVFVTGSNASLLSKELATRLTGRNVRLELFPFSYKEFLLLEVLEQNLNSFDSYLKNGGFPEFLIDKRVDIHQNLLRDIVMRDIAVRYGIRNTQSLMDLTLFLMSNIGKEFSYNNLRKIFSIGSTNTVVDYMNWLSDTYLLFYLPRFSWSVKSVAVNPRKVYAVDNGLAVSNSLSFTEDKGRMLENIVYQYLNQHYPSLFYFKEQKECDFVVFKEKKCQFAIQVCYEINSDNQQRELSGLQEAMDYFGLEEGYILTYNQTDKLRINGKNVHLIPVKEILVNGLAS